MRTMIWSKVTSKGLVETDGSIVTLDGKMIGNSSGSAVSLPRSKWMTINGTTYTHMLGINVPLTTDEAAAHDAAYRAMIKATVVAPSAESLFDLSHEMSKENSRW